MPELPEAEVVARQIRVRLVGARLIECWIGRADIVREGLPTLSWYPGAALEGVERYGKSVALEFKKDDELRYVVAELGMTGLLLFPGAQTKHPQHIHVRMSFTGGHESELRYWNPRRFGRLSLLDRAGLDCAERRSTRSMTRCRPCCTKRFPVADQASRTSMPRMVQKADTSAAILSM